MRIGPPTPLFSDKRLAATAGLAVLACLILMAMRLASTFLNPEPTQSLTSGAEYESLYAFWKAAHGLELYADQTRIPFAGTYYNWLYYALYSGVFRLTGLPDLWLPLTAKLTTLTGALAGLAVSVWLQGRLWEPQSAARRGLALATWTLVFLGPLMGFWAMAAAPDIWALSLDAASVLVFLTLYPKRPWRALLAFAALAYGAWAFKQVFVYSMGAVGLFLLLQRDWKRAFALAGLMAAAWAATLGLGPPMYRKMVFFGGSQVLFSLGQLFRNLGNFAVKCAPLIAGAALVLASPAPRRALRHDPVLRLAGLGILVSGLLSGAASAKLGAGENYYFTLSFHLVLFTLAGLRHGVIGPGLLAAGWAVTGAASLAAVLGLAGITDVGPNHRNVLAYSRCVTGLPGPVFVANPQRALPWLTPSEPAIVPHWNYPLDRKAGVAMEGGGIGGLITSGYFATVLVPEDVSVHDGGALAPRYIPVGRCSDMVIHRRKDLPP